MLLTRTHAHAHTHTHTHTQTRHEHIVELTKWGRDNATLHSHNRKTQFKHGGSLKPLLVCYSLLLNFRKKFLPNTSLYQIHYYFTDLHCTTSLLPHYVMNTHTHLSQLNTMQGPCQLRQDWKAMWWIKRSRLCQQFNKNRASLVKMLSTRDRGTN